MMRSLSEPSIGTVGTTNTEITVRSSRINIHHDQSKLDKLGLRGQRFFEGRLYRITMAVILVPWLMWWQILVHVTNVYQYVVLLLTEYYIEEYIIFLDTTICDLIFAADTFVYFLHSFWTLARLHIRVYRKSSFLLFYDLISLIPLRLIFQHNPEYRYLASIGCWLCICRIYRLLIFFVQVNEFMHRSRRLILVFQHFTLIALFLHATTCVWYHLHHLTYDATEYYGLGYPAQVGADQLRFDYYLSCLYFCSCRLLNVIFGDSFPIYPVEMWMTSVMMILGHTIIRYRFIGRLTWDLVVTHSRHLTFVDQFHHMLDYLQKSRAPEALVELAYTYKMQLWRMKDGVLTSDHLSKLPLPLQMELIYDINIGHFHDTLLFREAPEAFLRQISLLMRHEIFMAGQHIWNQDVVKNGLICLKKGVIEMLSDEDNESPMIAFSEGTVLGELSLFYSIPAKVTVTAATYVELQVLRRTDFMRAMTDKSSLLYEIRGKIESRLRKAQSKQESILAYEENDSRLIRTRYRPMKVLKNRLAGKEDEDPTFVDDSHMYYRDADNVRRPKFTEEFLELYQMSPKVTSILAPRICLRATFPWILEPDTDFMRMIQAVHFVMILYLCAMEPYSNIIQLTQTDAEKVLCTVITTGLLLNIYVQLTTAIYEKNVIRDTVRQISEVKMATLGFYLDILSVFPFHIFTSTLDPQSTSPASQVAALFPILQVWHIWEYMDSIEKNFKSNAQVVCVVKYTLMVTIFCYWSGCFLYLISCPNVLCRVNSWVKHLIYWETKVFSTTNAKHEKPMVSSLMFGTAAFTGSGVSDIAPGVSDLLVVVLIFVIGFYMTCFYTATLCSHFMLATQRRCKFRESMRELFCFLSVNHVSEKIKARVKKFFCVQWYYNNAVCVKELFEDMSANIQQEVLSIETVETLLYCPLFQDCSRDLLQTVASNSRTIVLPDNEVIQHAGDIGRDMYIVQRGHCNVINNQGKVVSYVGPGSQFGMIEMLFGLPKVYTVLTSTNCILLHMEYSALVQCWSTFPDISSPIMKVLDDPEIQKEAAEYEVARPMVGRIDTKTNRIAQEIKESFVALNGREERAEYKKAFEKLGVMRFLRYIIIPGCITPHGIFLKIWCIFRCFLAVYYLITVPYYIAITRSKFGLKSYYTDCLLYVDMIVMSYVAYYDEKSLLVTHPLYTITRYLKNGFVLDAIISFPMLQFVRLINKQIDSDLFRLNKLLQLTRIVAAVSYWEEDIMQDNQLIFLLKFLPAALTIVNFCSAISFLSSCVTTVPEGAEHIMANCTQVLVMQGKNHHVGGATSEYMSVFFHSFKIFIGCGCSPNLFLNKTDALIYTALAILAVLYFALMCGYVASARSSTGTALLDHIEKTSDLANFLYQENVDPILTARTLKYFEYLWRRTNGSNPQKICRRLNSALMEDTLVFMYERTLREVPLFSKVERSFIRVITQHLNEMYFLKAETIIQCKDVQPHIYIIYRGKVDVMNSYNEMITCMGPGGMFGNFTGHPISCSEVSIYASRSLDLLVIPAQTFFNLVKYYPKIQEPLNKAFETSKDYILPINVNIADDSDSEASEADAYSADSKFSSICTTDDSRYDMYNADDAVAATVRTATSQSNLSQTKSVGTMSALSVQSQTNIYNLFKPGTWMYLMGGYLTTIAVTANYVLVLYAITTLNDCYIILWILAIFDIYFYVTMYLTMHEGYASRRGELIMDASKCRRNYFNHKMLFYSDLFVNFPFILFGFCFPKTTKAMHYLRANKLFRIKYLFEFYNKSSVVLTNNLTTLQAVMTMHAVIFFVHSFTCLWLIVIIATQPLCTVRTIKSHFLEEETPNKVWDYTTSFYVMATLLTATGGDEYLVDDIIPELIQNICLLSGKVLAAVVVATAMQVTFSNEHTLTKYEKASGELMDVLKNQGLSDYQSQKLWKYIKQLWVTERGRQLPALLAQTPYVRRCDLMSAMFGQHLRNCYVFADTGESFLRQLTVAMEYTIFFPGNYIVVAGDSDARMHWVSSGTVSVVSVRQDLTETTHELLGPGDVFGILQGLHRGIIHCFSYRAETKVSILTLSLDSWIHILPYFPDAQNSITNRSNILFARITN